MTRNTVTAYPKPLICSQHVAREGKEVSGHSSSDYNYYNSRSCLCLFFSIFYSSSSKSPQTKPQNLSFSLHSPFHLSLQIDFLLSKTSPTHLPLHMDAPTSNHQDDQVLPELLTKYMVDMKCEGCVNAVKNKLQTINGVKNVEVDLSNQVVRILGCSSVKIMTEALAQTGRKARLIGQGVPD
ncbi:hypothetical protein LWI29_001274 [Acer saccharum]|uniref:HMA domain-containing protein n=1 Tax=Acer saccharum TaxID=4024 RepID=A0AA39W883_ACESA|nr:hypothetical protein LWI29_001274 [Acer saccharum]